MWAHINQHNLLLCHQSVYCSDCSIETALLKIVSDLLTNMDKDQVSLLFSLDLTRASNSVDHQILLQRLHLSLGLSGVALNWFTSFLSARTVSVVAKLIHIHILMNPHILLALKQYLCQIL